MIPTFSNWSAMQKHAIQVNELTTTTLTDGGD
jgi:hypothetical protein